MFKLATGSPFRQFHTSRIACNEWTKASLRRMKKSDLSRLAKENHLSISGTKNDIIIQLLTHQTAKIVGSTTPTLHSVIQVANKPEEQKEKEEQEVDAEWMKAFDMKVAQRGSRKPHLQGQPSKPHPFNDSIKKPTVVAAEHKEEEELEVDTEWMKAFDMKVAQRGSRKPLLRDQPSKPHPFNDFIKKPVEKPVEAVPEDKEKEQPKQKASSVVEEIEGMDPQWVEAFDLKIGSRGAKTRMIDTLSPSAPTLSKPIDELSFISVKGEEDATSDQQKSNITAANNQQTNTTTKDSTPSNKDTWISAAIGTGMLTWYFGGPEGMSAIWHFLTSSS